jgi:hypothetical protein
MSFFCSIFKSKNNLNICVEEMIIFVYQNRAPERAQNRTFLGGEKRALLMTKKSTALFGRYLLRKSDTLLRSTRYVRDVRMLGSVIRPY